MAYNEHEKDLEILEKLPLAKNPRYMAPKNRNVIANKDLKNLEMRISSLESQIKKIIIELNRINYKSVTFKKLLTQSEIDGYNTNKEAVVK